MYFAAGRLGLAVPFTNGNVSPLWPASGIALGAVLLWGYGVWPGILVASFLVNFSTHVPFSTSVMIAVGNTSSALIGGFLLKRIIGLQPSLVRLRDVLGLMTLGAVISPISAATVGVTALNLAHIQTWPRFISAWLVWWWGDAMGVLVAAPIFLAVSEMRRPFRIARRYELAALLIALTTMCLLVFTDVLGGGFRDDVLIFLLFPLVIWAAISFRMSGAAMANVIISAIAAWGTGHGYGPFVAHSPLHDVTLLQLFIAVAAATGITLAAVVSERQHISEAFETNQKLLRELENTERSLVENQTRLALAQHAARMGVWDWDLSSNQVCWSMGAPALYGITESTFRLSYQEWLNFVHPEDRDAVFRSVEHALKGLKDHDLEFRTVPPDGSLRWLAGRGKVFYDNEGRPVRMIGICVDITDLKQTQHALRQAHDGLEARVNTRTAELAESNRALMAEIKDRIRAQEALEFQTRRLLEQSRLLDLANDAIVICTLDGSVSYWNEGAERLYGWRRKEALIKPVEELLHTVFPAGLEEIKQTLFRQGSWEGELLQTTQSGERIFVASRWTLWKDQEGTPRGWLQINSNVSQRKQAEDALRELSGRLLHLQDEERRRLARELHDSTGQTLAALQMNLSVVQQRGALNQETAGTLGDSMKLVEQVVKEVRTLSYLLHPPLLDETGLASALRWYVDGLGQRSNLQIELNVSPQVGRLPQGMEIAVFRIVQECLTNIHRHSGSSTARIRIWAEAQELFLSVEDDGSGMPEGILEAKDGASGHLGVGIRGMQERVRDLAGQMRIRATNPGTAVEVRLAMPKREAPPSVPKSSQMAGVPTK